ncbi:LysR family transcriptional regulator [Pikeienuella piscinae]|uniref:LysR family transcriptional regulator n=1 Tax=Pikeienuella piscinae TaxID=2748098 RepID=A0A7L5C3A9_9RHOB|nr:LysR family transcriptional regulator [Pikeienuella piscinae]QIE56734.1 LysR family transcriptional regulator [Pikeienuella piscinae]
MKIDRRNDLNLRLLEVFEAVMRCGTTISAAEDLGVSQPAVSNAVKSLEKQLGLTLFERVSRVLRPTEDAHLLLTEVEPLFALLRNIEHDIRDLRATKAGRLRIATTPPLGHAALPTILRDFIADRPGVTVRYDVRRLDTVLQSVEAGMVDVGFVLGLTALNGYEIIPLYRGEMVCVMPADHPLGRLDVVTPQDLATCSFIGLETNLGPIVRAAFDQAGASFRQKIVVRYCHTACVLANAGLGVSVVDPFTAAFSHGMNIIFRPFEPAVPITASAVIRKDGELSKVSAAFIEEARAQLSR